MVFIGPSKSSHLKYSKDRQGPSKENFRISIQKEVLRKTHPTQKTHPIDGGLTKWRGPAQALLSRECNGTPGRRWYFGGGTPLNSHDFQKRKGTNIFSCLFWTLNFLPKALKCAFDQLQQRPVSKLKRHKELEKKLWKPLQSHPAVKMKHYVLFGSGVSSPRKHNVLNLAGCASNTFSPERHGAASNVSSLTLNLNPSPVAHFDLCLPFDVDTWDILIWAMMPFKTSPPPPRPIELNFSFTCKQIMLSLPKVWNTATRHVHWCNLPNFWSIKHISLFRIKTKTKHLINNIWTNASTIFFQTNPYLLSSLWKKQVWTF